MCIMRHPQALFRLFSFFFNHLLVRNTICWLQRDLNSDFWLRRLVDVKAPIGPWYDMWSTPLFKVKLCYKLYTIWYLDLLNQILLHCRLPYKGRVRVINSFQMRAEADHHHGPIFSNCFLWIVVKSLLVSLMSDHWSYYLSYFNSFDLISCKLPSCVFAMLCITICYK